MCIDGDLRRGDRTGSAWRDDARAANGAAIARSVGELCSDASGAAVWNGGSGGNDHGAASRAAGRQTGPLRWRAVPTARGRPRNARACTRRRQDTRDSAARQPRRRPHDPADRALCAGIALMVRVCLTGPGATSYMPRVRDCGIHAVTVDRGEVAQLVRARES